MAAKLSHILLLSAALLATALLVLPAPRDPARPAVRQEPASGTGDCAGSSARQTAARPGAHEAAAAYVCPDDAGSSPD